MTSNGEGKFEGKGMIGQLFKDRWYLDGKK